MVLAIVQARSGSTRLPGKVLKPVLGKTMLDYELERIKRATSLDQIIVATTTQPADQAVVALAERQGLEAFCGSEDDVLDRCYQAVMNSPAQHIVRLTGDCSLIDPAVIDQVVEEYLKATPAVSYASNVRPPTYPDGFDVEVFRRELLDQAWREAKLISEREHVTPYIYKLAGTKVLNVRHSEDLSGWRLTLDEASDLELLTKIIQALSPTKPNFTLADITTLLKQKPEWLKINAAFSRNEGYNKSLSTDDLI